jgi:hypothetical protein
VTAWTNTSLGTLLPSAGTDTSVFRAGKFPILDRVEPVISSAVLRYTSDTASVDTLKITFSENVNIDSLKIALGFKHAGDGSDSGAGVVIVGHSQYDSATRTISYYLKPVPASGAMNPGVGDSLRLTIAVKDNAGNLPQTVAKWTVITGNRRVIPPNVTLSNAVIANDGPAGTEVKDASGQTLTTLPLVIRPSQPGNKGDWRVLGADGKLTETGSPFRPGTQDYADKGSKGSVIFVQTNIPLQLTLYIYDNVGTYVTSQKANITQDILDKAQNAMAQDSILLSKVGIVDIGLLWNGQDENGHLVTSGIYPTRLIAYRDPTPEEKASGRINSLMYNRLVRVGVKLKTVK